MKKETEKNYVKKYSNINHYHHHFNHLTMSICVKTAIIICKNRDQKYMLNNGSVPYISYIDDGKGKDLCDVVVSHMNSFKPGILFEIKGLVRVINEPFGQSIVINYENNMLTNFHNEIVARKNNNEKINHTIIVFYVIESQKNKVSSSLTSCTWASYSNIPSGIFHRCWVDYVEDRMPIFPLNIIDPRSYIRLHTVDDIQRRISCLNNEINLYSQQPTIMSEEGYNRLISDRKKLQSHFDDFN
jgi:hypothetical protein